MIFFLKFPEPPICDFTSILREATTIFGDADRIEIISCIVQFLSYFKTDGT